jgi:hypothetical protein
MVPCPARSRQDEEGKHRMTTFSSRVLVWEMSAARLCSVALALAPGSSPSAAAAAATPSCPQATAAESPFALSFPCWQQQSSPTLLLRYPLDRGCRIRSSLHPSSIFLDSLSSHKAGISTFPTDPLQLRIQPSTQFHFDIHSDTEGLPRYQGTSPGQNVDEVFTFHQFWRLVHHLEGRFNWSKRDRSG